MAKNKKVKRLRSYKVQTDAYGVPYIHIKGKFLEDLEMGVGTHFEMIETDNMLILRKQTAAEISLKEVLRLRTTYKRLFNLCERYLETCIANQTLRRPESVEFIDQLKKCGEVMIALNVMALNKKRKASMLNIIDQYKAQLALCEHSFIEEDKHRIFSVVVDEYKKLLTLLKDGGKQLGIFKKRTVFGFKRARQALLNKYTYDSQPLKHHYQPLPNMGMVAENSESSYSVADEIANNPEKYSQAENG